MKESSFSKHKVEQILRYPCNKRVPLKHSFALICKLSGKSINTLAFETVYHRNSIYKALSGETQYQKTMAENIRCAIGVNPSILEDGAEALTARFTNIFKGA